jgi:hypothetical protein
VIRTLRVVRSEPRAQYEASCRWCGRLAFWRTDESIHRLGLPRWARASLVPRKVFHDCMRIAPGRQLLHRGGKP